MNVDELLERIAAGENLHTDFKADFDSPREVAKDLVCLANTDGGDLIFGVAQDRRVVGVPDPEGLCLRLDDVAFQHCEPPVTAVPEVLTLDVDGERKHVVVVHVDKGDQRPYRTTSGQYYVRGGARCRQASREELLRLFQAVRSLYYDESPVRRATLADLDRDAVEKYLEQTGQGELRGDVDRLLRNWRLCDDQHPTVAGLLLFGYDPQTHLPYAQINAARFPGSDDSEEPTDRKDLKGRLLDVIDQARRFLVLHLATPHKIEGFKPEPRPELPEEVLREAIVNAVAHRDYSVHGPIRLLVFRDRVEVRTPGRAPNTVDEEAMRAGVHVVRNPHIYARLSDAGLVTRAGTGVRRIVRLVRETTGQEVILSCRDFEVYLSIPRPMASL